MESVNRHKEYYQKNKEKILANRRQDYADNKDEILKRNKKHHTKIKSKRAVYLRSWREKERIRQIGTLLEQQQYKCANPGCSMQLTLRDSGSRANTACADHCHETGEPRGVLCWNCNVAAGQLQDDPIRCEGLATYLREHHVRLKTSKAV